MNDNYTQQNFLLMAMLSAGVWGVNKWRKKYPTHSFTGFQKHSEILAVSEIAAETVSKIACVLNGFY